MVGLIGAINDSDRSVNGARSAPGRKWYEGGTLHYKTVREWKQGSYADKLATCADCLAILSSEGILDAGRFRFTSPESVRPHAEAMVGFVDAALARGFVTIDGAPIKVDENKKGHEIISMLMIEKGWNRP